MANAPVDDEQIAQWKEQYGEIYSASEGKQEYVFRALTLDEHALVRRAQKESIVDAQEKTVELGLLHPRPLSDRTPAGVITTLAEEILEVSGFGHPKHMRAILEEERSKVAGDIQTLMKGFILATMPGYTEEELNLLTFRQLSHKLALAETIMQVNRASIDMDGDPPQLEIIDPELEAQRQAEEARKHAVQKKPGTAGYNDPIAQKLHNALGG